MKSIVVKLNTDREVVYNRDTIMIIDADAEKVYLTAGCGGKVLQMINGHRDVDEIVQCLCQEFKDDDVELIKKDVENFIDMLLEHNICSVVYVS